MIFRSKLIGWLFLSDFSIVVWVVNGVHIINNANSNVVHCLHSVSPSQQVFFGPSWRWWLIELSAESIQKLCVVLCCTLSSSKFPSEMLLMMWTQVNLVVRLLCVPCVCHTISIPFCVTNSRLVTLAQSPYFMRNYVNSESLQFDFSLRANCIWMSRFFLFSLRFHSQSLKR